MTRKDKQLLESMIAARKRSLRTNAVAARRSTRTLLSPSRVVAAYPLPATASIFTVAFLASRAATKTTRPKGGYETGESSSSSSKASIWGATITSFLTRTIIRSVATSLAPDHAGSESAAVAPGLDDSA